MMADELTNYENMLERNPAMAARYKQQHARKIAEQGYARSHARQPAQQPSGAPNHLETYEKMYEQNAIAARMYRAENATQIAEQRLERERNQVLEGTNVTRAERIRQLVNGETDRTPAQVVVELRSLNAREEAVLYERTNAIAVVTDRLKLSAAKLAEEKAAEIAAVTKGR